MFIFNEKTEVNMQFKMLELFRTIKADKLVKADAGNVVKVVLANVLSPDRTNMEANETTKEIYIFNIELNSNKVPVKFLDTLNKSINLQTLFKLYYNDKVKYIISIKEFAEERMKVLKYFESDWETESFEETPNVLKLENLFKQMIANITTYLFRDYEDFKQYIDRLNSIEKQKKEIEKMTKAMNAEKQPNLKMKLNDEIKFMKRKLKEVEGN